MTKNQTIGLLVALFASSHAFADQIIGLPPDTGVGNCVPFGCSYSGEYQQVYTASAFSGPIAITNLEFYNTQFNNGATAMNSGTWTISLSTTAADWNTLSTNYAANIGANNTEVFSGNLSQPWTFGDTLHINLSTPFTYNPGSGNLLMDVFVSGATAPGGNIYFDTNGFFVPNTIIGRVSGDTVGNSAVDNGYGLVTGFSTGTVNNAPEPASLTLLGAALLGFEVLRRHRKAN